MADNKKPVNPRAVIGEIIAKCWQDEGYKKTFVSNPKKILIDAGLAIPEKIRIKVVESSAKILYAILPARISVDILQKTMTKIVNHGIAGGLKLSEGGELRFVQNTASIKYIVIPEKPLEDELSDVDLEIVAGGKKKHKGGVITKTNVVVEAEVAAAGAIVTAGGVAAAGLVLEAGVSVTTAAVDFEVAAEVVAVIAIFAS